MINTKYIRLNKHGVALGRFVPHGTDWRTQSGWLLTAYIGGPRRPLRVLRPTGIIDFQWGLLKVCVYHPFKPLLKASA